MPVFRIAASTVLLTYSQSNELTKEDILHTLEERLPPFNYAIGYELHNDGGNHVHALLKAKVGKFDTKDPTIFDVNTGEEQFHPNIQPVKRGKAHFDRAHEYVEKEDLDHYCTFPHRLTWSEILEHSSCYEEYIDLVKKNYPRDWALNLQRLEYGARKLFPTDDPDTIPESYVVDYEHDDIQVEPNFSKTIVIIGQPGCGKTTWAKKHAPKPALFLRHLDVLSQIKPEHKSIIFDDLDFNHLPVSTQKYLVDYENICHIHCRYRVAKIPKGVVRIITGNEYPFVQHGIHAEAINRRINRIDL